MNNQVSILNIRFDSDISLFEIPKFRGAVISKVPRDSIFHNHSKEGYIYRYPMIQYKRLNNKAFIVCVNIGMDSIGEFLGKQDFSMHIGSRQVNMHISSINVDKHRVQIWNDTFYYTIRKWLPLNQLRYKEYDELDTMIEKYAFLEKILTGNILSFAKGLGIWFDEKIECHIKRLEDMPRKIQYKGVKHIAFDLTFSSNVSLPNYIGIGKGVSMGFGMITAVKKN